MRWQGGERSWGLAANVSAKSPQIFLLSAALTQDGSKHAKSFAGRDTPVSLASKETKLDSPLTHLLMRGTVKGVGSFNYKLSFSNNAKLGPTAVFSAREAVLNEVEEHGRSRGACTAGEKALSWQEAGTVRLQLF